MSKGARLPEEEFDKLLAERDEAMASGAITPDGQQPEAELPSELRKRMDVLRRLHRLRRQAPEVEPPPTQLGHPPPASPRESPAPLARIGPFEVRGELGRGGFGVVYHGHDPRVGREVAVKVPHPHVLVSPELLLRFKQEARAAAVLDHPNVVPVYEADELGPICYIASAYCPGPTLFAWLKDRQDPVPVREAAQLVLQLAQAVQHAHERGLLHRDLKPSNVLLQTSPGSANAAAGYLPRITDFGLAKFVDAAAGAAAPETRSGEIVGTPSYMAPEQTLGSQKVTAATDVYALGTILYEVLTRRPPFLGDSILETLMQVRNNNPVAIRSLRPKVPRDLETICLKCLRKEPARRYPTAQALADDLGNFLAGRPILARPVGPIERTWRWARSKPMVASLLAALILVFLLGFGGMFLQWQHAQANATRASKERDEAQFNYRLAREAVDKMSGIGQRLSQQPKQSKAGREVLETALTFYLDFLKRKSEDPRLQLDAARAWAEVGWLRYKLGERSQADEALRESIKILEQLLEAEPGKYEYRSMLVHFCRDHANVARALGDSSRAERLYNRAIELGKAMISDGAATRADRSVLANALLNRSALFRDVRRDEAALRDCEESIEFLKEVLVVKPRNRVYRSELGLARCDLALVYLGMNRLEEAETQALQSREIHQALYDEGRREGTPELLARSYLVLCQIAVAHQQDAKGEKHALTGISYLEQEVKEFPDILNIRDILANGWLQVAYIRGRANRVEEAQEAFRKAAEARPEGPSLRSMLAHWLLTCPNERHRNPKEALRLAEKLPTVAPDALACWNVLGLAQFRNGQLNQALQTLQKGCEVAVPSGGDGFTWLYLALTQAKRGEKAEARKWLDKAGEWMDRHRRGRTDVQALRKEAEALLASGGGK